MGTELLAPGLPQLHGDRLDPYGSIRGLLLDRDESLWLATERGLTRFRWAHSSGDPLLEPLGSTSLALYQDAELGLWIGTQGSGLFLLKLGPADAVHDRSNLPAEVTRFTSSGKTGWVNLDERPERRRLGVAARFQSLPPRAARHSPSDSMTPPRV